VTSKYQIGGLRVLVAAEQIHVPDNEDAQRMFRRGFDAWWRAEMEGSDQAIDYNLEAAIDRYLREDFEEVEPVAVFIPEPPQETRRINVSPTGENIIIN